MFAADSVCFEHGILFYLGLLTKSAACKPTPRGILGGAEPAKEQNNPDFVLAVQALTRTKFSFAVADRMTADQGSCVFGPQIIRMLKVRVYNITASLVMRDQMSASDHIAWIRDGLMCRGVCIT